MNLGQGGGSVFTWGKVRVGVDKAAPGGENTV